MQLTGIVGIRPQAGMCTIPHVHMSQTCSWGDHHA
jgi:hypothetical protein